MSINTNDPLRPLTIGNVVTTGLVLYRSNLNRYFGLALKSTLWLGSFILPLVLIPIFALSSSTSMLRIPLIISVFFFGIYGIAKYMANQAIISRLAYQEMINEPESVSEAGEKVYPRMWKFFRISLYIGLRLLGIYILMWIGIATAIGLFLNQKIAAATGVLSVVVIVGILIIIRFVSRWLVSEVVLAVEEDVNASSSIQRSWDLSESAVGRLQLIVFVAFLVTLPIQLVTSSLPQFLLGSVAKNFSTMLIAQLISLGCSLVGTLLVIPFWQAIKAVIYYDLRSRREGIDLQIRR